MTVSPSVRPRRISFETVAVAIARQIEPVPRPLLTVVRRTQQAIDYILIRFGMVVTDELFDFRRRRRQADQIEAEPANQRRSMGLGRRCDALGIQFGPNEPVDRISQPTRVVDFGRCETHWRNESPMRALDGGRFNWGERFAFRPFGPGGSSINPRPQQSNLFRCKSRPRHRHDAFFVETRNQVDQTAAGAVAGLDDSSGIPALEHGFAAVEPQAAAFERRPVTGQTFFL